MIDKDRDGDFTFNDFVNNIPSFSVKEVAQYHKDLIKKDLDEISE